MKIIFDTTKYEQEEEVVPYEFQVGQRVRYIGHTGRCRDRSKCQTYPGWRPIGTEATVTSPSRIWDGSTYGGVDQKITVEFDDYKESVIGIADHFEPIPS
jgi:hypothetical protein